ncbi:uncharacterized protein JCM10292_005017 [Rhodotorula paludigena]|uniref:uncharacterized protein n=1 Tax=Rhodotorula paludigena TaxID=86838 RepID=UPI00317CD73D
MEVPPTIDNAAQTAIALCSYLPAGLRFLADAAENPQFSAGYSGLVPLLTEVTALGALWRAVEDVQGGHGRQNEAPSRLTKLLLRHMHQSAITLRLAARASNFKEVRALPPPSRRQLTGNAVLFALHRCLPVQYLGSIPSKSDSDGSITPIPATFHVRLVNRSPVFLSSPSILTKVEVQGRFFDVAVGWLLFFDILKAVYADPAHPRLHLVVLQDFAEKHGSLACLELRDFLDGLQATDDNLRQLFSAEENRIVLQQAVCDTDLKGFLLAEEVNKHFASHERIGIPDHVASLGRGRPRQQKHEFFPVARCE